MDAGAARTGGAEISRPIANPSSKRKETPRALRPSIRRIERRAIVRSVSRPRAGDALPGYETAMRPFYAPGRPGSWDFGRSSEVYASGGSRLGRACKVSATGASNPILIRGLHQPLPLRSIRPVRRPAGWRRGWAGPGLPPRTGSRTSVSRDHGLRGKMLRVEPFRAGEPPISEGVGRRAGRWGAGLRPRPSSTSARDRTLRGHRLGRLSWF